MSRLLILSALLVAPCAEAFLPQPTHKAITPAVRPSSPSPSPLTTASRRKSQARVVTQATGFDTITDILIATGNAPNPVDKLWNDEVYRPLFFEAINLGLIGIFTAVVVAVGIWKGGDSFEKLLLDEALVEEKKIVEGFVYDGSDPELIVGKVDKTEASISAVASDAVKKEEPARELVSAAATRPSSSVVDDDED